MQLPAEFLKTISHSFPDKESFLSSLAEPPPVSIRLNPAKLISDYDNTEAVLWHPLGRYLQERPVFTLDPLFHAGTYYVQEASSMFLHQAFHQAVDLKRDLKVLDLCAAPGGKSTLLAAALSDDSFLLVNEVIRKRIDPLQHNLTKWGNTNVMISNHDSSDLSELAGFFDVVCVDAPCSGEGLFRKDPNAVNEWSRENVSTCSARQKRILQESVGLIAENGVLIYSTCTYNAEENDNNMEWLCGQFGFEEIQLEVPKEWGIVKTKYGYQFYPHCIKGEGFYISVLRKANASHINRSKNKSIKGLMPLSNKDFEPITHWVREPERFSFFQKPNNEIVIVPKALEETFATVAGVLKRRSSGLEIGMVKQKNLIPSHALALSNAISQELPVVHLEKYQAQLFLKKENFEIESPKMGWHLVQYEGFNIGWVKLLGHRFNNYLPNEWRIRMDLN